MFFVQKMFPLLQALLTAALLLTATEVVASTGDKLNRLQHESSPYLLQHARNPVDWYPWGQEAFDRAREENKPIFLSIGYTTCYWCQVMERESFESEETAAILNRYFVSVKVDREERPDIDQIYMAAVQLLNQGRGGWPMSVFLTPELKPFHAGTYFPNNYFNEMLESIQKNWSNQNPQVIQMAEQITESLKNRSLQEKATDQPLPTLEQVERAVIALEKNYDQDRGGFGGPPKFPRPSIYQFLLTHYEETGHKPSLSMTVESLKQMAKAGIYDHLAGGFHRYATDAAWQVPHFEKMLYDNAQLLNLYSRAYGLTGEEDFRRVSLDIIDYVGREMKAAEGLFYSAQDSGIHGEEGRGYIWDIPTLKEILSPEDFNLAGQLYGYDQGPNFEGHAILHRPIPMAELAKKNSMSKQEITLKAQRIRKQLLQHRKKGEQPLTDDKQITAWNGLMIEALAYASQAVMSPEALNLAEQAAHKLLTSVQDKDGRLLHVRRGENIKLLAYLDDYAALILGLTELDRVSQARPWGKEAKRLADEMLTNFEDPQGGFHYAQEGVPHLLLRPKGAFDGAIPSGNSLALQALVALREGNPAYDLPIKATLRAFSAQLSRAPSAMPAMLEGFLQYQKIPAQANEPVNLLRTEQVIQMTPGTPSRPLSTGEPSRMQISLTVDEGWHLGANPALLEFVLPTTLTITPERGSLTSLPHYPPGDRLATPLGSSAVYSNEIIIPVDLFLTEGPESGNQLPVELGIRAQACNDEGRCLLPSTLKRPLFLPLR